MRDIEEQEAIRADIFRWLDDQLGSGKSEFTHLELKNYEYRGERIPLKDNFKGIWNPRDFDTTLSITTSIADPYDDVLGADLSLKYSYQAKDGGNNIVAPRNGDAYSASVSEGDSIRRLRCLLPCVCGRRG
jgi:putative restriction endonuclease